MSGTLRPIPGSKEQPGSSTPEMSTCLVGTHGVVTSAYPPSLPPRPACAAVSPLPRAPAAPTAPLLVWHLLQVTVEVHLRQEGTAKSAQKKAKPPSRIQKRKLLTRHHEEAITGSGQCDFYLTAGLLVPTRMSLKKPDRRKEDFSAKCIVCTLIRCDSKTRYVIWGTMGEQQTLSGNVHFLAVVLASV